MLHARIRGARMSRHIRRICPVVVALLASRIGSAQITGTLTQAAHFAPVDASTLGAKSAATVGLSLGQDEFVGALGGALRGGKLRGFVGQYFRRWSVGAGFASRVASRRLLPGLAGNVGGELVGGYRHLGSVPHTAAALNLTMPVSLTLGDANDASFSLYAAPYGEAGVMRTLKPNQVAVRLPRPATMRQGSYTR
jgi:hypothetical protein